MSRHKLTKREQTAECLLFTAPNWGIKVDVLLSNGTSWLRYHRQHSFDFARLWPSTDTTTEK